MKRKKGLVRNINMKKAVLSTSLLDFDHHVTAPLHGYLDAFDYYKNASSIYYLDAIKVPTLIINAKNDPLLSPQSFPYTQCEKNNHLKLEVPSFGGHVGFLGLNLKNEMYSEKRAWDFVKEIT